MAFLWIKILEIYLETDNSCDGGDTTGGGVMTGIGFGAGDPILLHRKLGKKDFKHY